MKVPTSVAVLFVLLMIAFVGVFFAMGLIFDDDPDGFKKDREYIVHGTVDGEEVTGTGVAKYLEEGSNSNIYRFTFNVNGKEYISDLIFDSPDYKPHAGFYTYIGDEGQYEVWVNDLIKSPVWTYTIGDKCVVVHVTLVGEGVDLSADFKSV